MTGFAPFGLACLGIFIVYINRYACVVVKLEVFDLFVVAVGAGFPADVEGAGD